MVSGRKHLRADICGRTIERVGRLRVCRDRTISTSARDERSRHIRRRRRTPGSTNTMTDACVLGCVRISVCRRERGPNFSTELDRLTGWARVIDNVRRNPLAGSRLEQVASCKATTAAREMRRDLRPHDGAVARDHREHPPACVDRPDRHRRAHSCARSRRAISPRPPSRFGRALASGSAAGARSRRLSDLKAGDHECA